ncbi:MAG TPA: PAS domain-containing protein [Baekduia sp.]|uniref:PAS domain-containing protein n=1 Tax=Baekduia sp. TaxID=2600305 RepID=UPI002D79D97F|nr:PAS domain-containing protein [Baekduia sp.]HET6505834.1 PAS domain-containing protein [Baekduia sp.]
MSSHAVTGHERPFSLDELFFSTTDPKGVIRSGNEVFARVSAIPLEDMVGKAHNVVRHPDMPRAVFRTFWEALHAGRGVAAYVKNRSADGGFYWVMAFVVPIADGYLSVRLKPTSPLFAVAQEIYREVARVEREVEGGDVRRRKPSIAAGVEKLEALLAEHGFSSYRAFMHAALMAEVTARAAALGTAGETDAIVRDAEAALDRLVADLERYGELATALGEKSAFVLDLAEEIRLFALNAVLSSARLGEEGAALGAVAEILGRRSDEAEPPIRALKTDLDAALELLGAMGFRIAASKLMTEMVGAFLADLRATGAEPASLAGELTALADGLADGGERLAVSITDFSTRLEAVESGVRVVDSHLRVVRALEVNGRVEGARLHDEAIIDLFGTIAHQVADAREQLKTFAALRDATHAKDARADAAAVRSSVTGAAEHVLALARA